MKECSRILGEQFGGLFILDKNIRGPLLEIRNICLKINKIEFMDMQFQEPLKYQQFIQF